MLHTPLIHRLFGLLMGRFVYFQIEALQEVLEKLKSKRLPHYEKKYGQVPMVSDFWQKEKEQVVEGEQNKTGESSGSVNLKIAPLLQTQQQTDGFVWPRCKYKDFLISIEVCSFSPLFSLFVSYFSFLVHFCVYLPQFLAFCFFPVLMNIPHTVCSN